MNVKKQLFPSIILIIFILSIASCKNSSNENNNNSDTDSVSVNTEVSDNKTGKIHLDFPAVSTTAKAGDYVLAPSLSFLEDALSGEGSTFVFYSRKCVEVGEKTSLLEEIGKQVEIPNSLIVPIPAGETVSNGDIVLTWWQSGSGMTRAIITDATNAESPKAIYLDIDDIEEEQLQSNTFTKITSELQAGTSIAYKDGNQYNHYQVIRIEGSKVLAMGWAGKLSVLDKSGCIAIPVNPELEKGEKVQVPNIGSYTNGTVKKYDKKTGRAIVEIEFAGQKDEISVPTGDIAKNIVI